MRLLFTVGIMTVAKFQRPIRDLDLLDLQRATGERTMAKKAAAKKPAAKPAKKAAAKKKK